MKKKIFLMLPCIAAVAIATFVGKKTFESNEFETDELFLQNVEALSAGEGFNGSFNGQDWDTEDHYYNKFGTDWCPVMFTCTVTSGSWNISVGVGNDKVHGNIGYTSGTSTYPGHYISCHSGKGNCYNGTDCVRD